MKFATLLTQLVFYFQLFITAYACNGLTSGSNTNLNCQHKQCRDVVCVTVKFKERMDSWKYEWKSQHAFEH